MSRPGWVVVALAGLCAGCRGSRAASDATADSGAAVQAGTAVATVQPFRDVVSAIGTVVPRPGRFAELAAPAPTRVARIFVTRSEERRVGKECRSRWSPYH